MSDAQATPTEYDGALLREIMELRALGFSQSEIGEQLNTSQQTVSRYLLHIKSAAGEYDDPTDMFYHHFAERLGYRMMRALEGETDTRRVKNIVGGGGGRSDDVAAGE